MAGRKSFVVAHPDNENTETVLKGGKAPEYATWALMNGEWERIGWSYGDKDKAERTAKSSIGSLGYTYTVTRVLPAGF